MHQRNRGTQGFGLFDNQTGNLVRHTQEKPILRYIKKNPSSDILFHHRIPTSTINIKNACHPFSTGDRYKTNYILIHNGWITNDIELFQEHSKNGISYTSMQKDLSFNDSECLLWDFARYKENDQAFMQARGAVAFICMALNEQEGDKLYFYHNGSEPLRMQLDESGIILASEGEGESVPEDYLFCFDYRTRLLTFEKLFVAAYSNSSYSHGGFSRNDEDYRRWKEDDDDELALVRHTASSHSTFDDEDSEVRAGAAEREIDLFSHPMHRDGIKELWPQNAPFKYQKAVMNYYNRLLLAKNGDYDDALIQMEADESKLERRLKEVVRPKSIKKWAHKLQTCKIAQDMLLEHPFFNGDSRVDPSFIAGENIETRQMGFVA